MSYSSPLITKPTCLMLNIPAAGLARGPHHPIHMGLQFPGKGLAVSHQICCISNLKAVKMSERRKEKRAYLHRKPRTQKKLPCSPTQVQPVGE